MKRFVCLCLTVLTLFSLFAFALPCFAQGGILKFSVNEFGNAVLDSCDPSAKGTVVVPGKVEIDGQEYPVREVGKGAFSGCAYIQHITIEEGIMQIGNKAFENCTALETLDIPKSLMSCQYDAFDGCNMVTVNGYSENYQFFAVNFFSKNVTFNRIDKSADPGENERTNSLISFIRSVLAYFLSLIGVKF